MEPPTRSDLTGAIDAALAVFKPGTTSSRHLVLLTHGQQPIDESVIGAWTAALVRQQVVAHLLGLESADADRRHEPSRHRDRRIDHARRDSRGLSFLADEAVGAVVSGYRVDFVP